MTVTQDLLRSHRMTALFLAKMLAVYAVWFVLYDLWLLPDGRVDAVLSDWNALATARLLDVLGVEAVATAGGVVSTQGIAIQIVSGCNGLSALSLFVGFVVAYPGTWARRAVFLPAGLLTIVAVNVVRCAVLLYVLARWPGMFESAHAMHGLFLFYVVIFSLWVLWAHVGDPAQARASAKPAAAS